MPITASDKGGQEFTPIPAGTHHAVCYGVVDLGTQPNSNPQYPDYRKVCVLWEVPGERAEFPDKNDKSKKVNRPRAISAIYTLSLSEKANLRKILESWRAKPFNHDELAGFDISKLIGANCFLTIVHNPGRGANAGKLYANVAGVSALPKTMPKVAPENDQLYFSLSDFGSTEEVEFPPHMPEWLVNKVKGCRELMEAQEKSSNPPPAHKQADQEEDDNIPF